MPRNQQPEEQFPVKLTQAQLTVIADIAPELANRLKLDEKPQRTIQLTLAELKVIKEKAGKAIRQAKTGMVRNSLRHVTDIASQALDHFQGLGSIPVSERLYQFKITLKDFHPPIWRRIQVKNCTLDELHEHLQTAMGWTNSHLHHFEINEQFYGDPWLVDETFEEFGYEDSTSTRISEILPKSGKRFRFKYEYDFGDSWWHEILFEGCLRAERGKRYPVCIEGERACPPEDVGGTWGYKEFLAAIADPDHEEHEEFLHWIGGRFDPEEFDPTKATKRMWRGLPDWRKMV